MKTQNSANTAKPTVDFICPTFNNGPILGSFVQSVTCNTLEPFRLIVVNNGDPDAIMQYLPANDHRVVLLNAPKNLGWMGGINAGTLWAMAHDPAKYICFINDDVQIIDQDYGWLTKMLQAFDKPNVGAVGPTSNAVMGYQSQQYTGMPPYLEASRLSGMCMLVRRDIIEKIGLLDETLPGGDDFDYSIRIRDAGFKLCICRRTFMLHHCSVTGKKLFGAYWNSEEYAEKINAAIIHKHGFRKWFCCANDILEGKPGWDFVGGEEKLVMQELEPHLDGVVLDLGCGGKKIHPKVVGVDIRVKGQLGVGYNSRVPSGGEVACDAIELTPFKDGTVDAVLAKHLLEHILDIPKALKEWHRVLKDGGRMVIVVPDWRFCEAISCDPSHVHGFTPESLSSIINAIGGFRITRTENVEPGFQTMISCEKIPSPVSICSCHPCKVAVAA